MIAGETENIVGLDDSDSFYEYDEWWGSKKEKNPKKVTIKTADYVAEKRKNRSQFGKGIGNFFKSNGGLEGVTGSVGNLVGIFRGDSTAQTQNTATPGQANFQVGLNGQNPPPQDKKPIELYIVGGAVVLGLLVVGVKTLGKGKSTPITVAN
ncbi:MAG: hypothetical protein JXQ90_18440 [Cyclobacteriaceae bacterium]